MPKSLNCLFFKNGVCNLNGKKKACVKIVFFMSDCSDLIEHKKPAPPPAPPKINK